MIIAGFKKERKKGKEGKEGNRVEPPFGNPLETIWGKVGKWGSDPINEFKVLR